MSKRKLRTVFAVAMITIAFAGSMVLASCQRSQQQASGGKPVVVVVLKTLSSPYWQTVLSGARAAAEEFGFELVELGPASEDHVTEQINMLEDAISQGNIAGIVFSPSQPPTAINALNRASAANIPVAVVDTPMPDGFDAFLTFIGSNNYQIGVLGAQEMLKVLPAGGRVMILEGAPGNVATMERADGAESVFRGAGIVIESRQPGYSDRERAFSIIQNVLQRGDIDGVFAANDDMAEGALFALTQSNKRAVVLGVDGNLSARESVRDGGLFGTVAQDAAGMGFQGVEAIHRVLNGQNVERRIDANTPVITSANVSQHL